MVNKQRKAGKTSKLCPKTKTRSKKRSGMANQSPRTPLLPVGVNNNATMPRMSQNYVAHGEEVLSIVNVAGDTAPGQVIFNQQISPASCSRLSKLADLWQRIDWEHTVLNVVALNGSVVTAGYNVGFIEDPVIDVPTANSEVIPFLTALRGTSVRQNWVQSTTGQSVTLSKLPEMYTTRDIDIRRYSIGRLVMALTGPVGTAGASFQILLKYRVHLYVPKVVPTIVPSEGIQIFATEAASLFGSLEDTVDDAPYAISTTPIPPIGRYYFSNGHGSLIYTAGPTGNKTKYIVGFEVFGGVGGTDWGVNTRMLLNDINNPQPWPNRLNTNPSNDAWCTVDPLDDTSENFRQTVFNDRARFIYLA